jgi:hypothetical protein
MGDPLDEATDIGTVISKPQLDKIQRYIALGKGEQGATAHECSALPTDASLSKVRACVSCVSCRVVCVVSCRVCRARVVWCAHASWCRVCT